MKKIFTLFVAAVAAVMMSAKTAESGSCGPNLNWTFNASTGELIISGTGPMNDYSTDNYAPWFAYNDKIKYLTIEPGITAIGDYAFYGLGYVEYTKIPEGVTSIGDYAFDICLSMESIYIPYGVKAIGDCAFGGCVKLSKVELPYGVTSIGSHAFAWTGIEKIVIPATVSSIGDYAFQNCPNLTSIYNLATTPQTINANVFDYVDKSKCALYVPDYADDNYNQPVWSEFERRMVGTYMSVENSGFHLSMDFAAGVLTLHGSGILPFGVSFDYASQIMRMVADLFGNSQIIELSLPEGLSTIGEYFFEDLHALTSVAIPESVVMLKQHSFRNCYSLGTLIIPSATTIIEDYVFANCRSLKTVFNYAATPQLIDESVFYNVDVSQCMLYVPNGSKQSYESADVWRRFVIEEMPALEAIDHVNHKSETINHKFIKDGQLFIERNGMTYNILGTPLR